MISILSTFLHFYVFHLFLYTANNIRMLQSDMENIATKETGKAFAEANNYFNFSVEKSQWLGNILQCNYTAKWLRNG